ncbi:hypothetical protein [Microseira wollei]|uniref:Uncharacterized protein n=1 Tax=Microseira wollei NIES-4236 TaxID=2530354 RepID=A0AAV3XD90_9CYAN|nr:hypothetical protein [Microseira wollei]GET39845.1 hypothetical protein MiSe_46170 [Microseira wollei NIES-4236]
MTTIWHLIRNYSLLMGTYPASLGRYILPIWCYRENLIREFYLDNTALKYYQIRGVKLSDQFYFYDIFYHATWNILTLGIELYSRYDNYLNNVLNQSKFMLKCTNIFKITNNFVKLLTYKVWLFRFTFSKIMNYDTAIRYFVTERPPDPRIKKGAMLRSHRKKGYLFSQVFLDKENQLVCKQNGIPYGRQILVKQFDEELNESFGDKDLIIVE